MWLKRYTTTFHLLETLQEKMKVGIFLAKKGDIKMFHFNEFDFQAQSHWHFRDTKRFQRVGRSVVDVDTIHDI